MKFNLRAIINTASKSNSGNNLQYILKWKKSIANGIVIFSGNYSADVLWNRTWKTTFPIFINTLTITAFSVPLMTFIVMPKLNVILNKWLVPKDSIKVAY